MEAVGLSTEECLTFPPLVKVTLATTPLIHSLLVVSASELPRDDCSALASIRAGFEASCSPTAVTYLWTSDAGGTVDVQVDNSTSTVPLEPSERGAWLRWSDVTLWASLHARPPPQPDGSERVGVIAMNAVITKLAAAVVPASPFLTVIAIVGHELIALPAAVRSLLTARYGSDGGGQPAILFVLPTAFAAAETFRTLAPRSSLLVGALGADAIHLPDAEWARQLSNSAVNALGVDASPLRVAAPVSGEKSLTRFVTLVVTPLGIDSHSWESGEVETAADADAESARIRLEASLRARHGRVASAIVLPPLSPQIQIQSTTQVPLRPIARPALVASLCDDDDTSALPARLAAIEIFFSRYSMWRGRVTFVIFVRIASTHCNGARAVRRAVVDEACGRVCGEIATASWEPLIILRGKPIRADIRALFASASVGLFTSNISGTATEAHAFVTSHAHSAVTHSTSVSGGGGGGGGGSSGGGTPPTPAAGNNNPVPPGVLIIGPAVGGASLLQGALVASPTDPAAVADAIATALAMGRRERETRHAQLLAAVRFFNARSWGERVLEVTAMSASIAVAAEKAAASPAITPIAALHSWRGDEAALPPRILFLSLSALRGAAVTQRIGTSLTRLRSIGVSIIIFTARDSVHAAIAAATAISAGAELGASRGAEWKGWSKSDVSAPWMTGVRELMEEFSVRTPGAIVTGGGGTGVGGGIEWRWAHANDVELGAARARDLLLALRAADIEGQGADASLDRRRERVIVRAAGLGASALVARVREAVAAEVTSPGNARVLAIVGSIASSKSSLVSTTTTTTTTTTSATATASGEITTEKLTPLIISPPVRDDNDTADDEAGDDDDELRRAADVGIALSGGVDAVEEYIEELAALAVA
jgi:trehalose-6-phosphate synthase